MATAQAILCSSSSVFCPPPSAAWKAAPHAVVTRRRKKRTGKSIIVFNPHERPSEELRAVSTYYKHIPRDLPTKCQLPDVIPVGTHGRTIHRPAAWAAPATA